MEELFQMIGETIRTSSHTGPVDREEIYNEICDEIEDKGPGSYLFISKKEDSVFYEYKVGVMTSQFNLSYLDVHTPERLYHIDFDA